MSYLIDDVMAGNLDDSDDVDVQMPPLTHSHPGKILYREWLEPLGLSAYALAKAINVPRNRITEILNGERVITTDTAMRLARYFGTDARSWLNLQLNYELATAGQSLWNRIEGEVAPRHAAALSSGNDSFGKGGRHA